MDQHILGHRGASGYAPENTLEAFELAAVMGAYGVELDAHLTRDDVIVVTHDETIDRCSEGHGRVMDYTLAELKSLRFNKTHPEYRDARIPTLKEVFQLLKPLGLMINIELKNSEIDYPDLERKVIELAAKEFDMDRVIFSSFNHYSMLKVKKLDPAIKCGLLYDGTLVRPWDYARTLGMDALHPMYTELLIPGGECAEAHKLSLQVNPWTVNREEDLRAVIKAGADHIITNYPDRALEILNEGAL